MDCGSIRGIADEVDCGISAFANLELKPIGGSLKSFPEDFVVEELPLEDVPNGGTSIEDLPYLRFRLKKRGVDTLEAVDALATACQVPAQKFGFAGIKDSFAITTQYITVPASAVSEAALRSAVSSLPYIELSHFCRSKQRLLPGQLRGNRFIIRVRGVRSSVSEVGEAMESLSSKGFVNYVGMQRFGKAGLRSDLVGLAYLQGNYERCVDLLLRQGGDQTCGQAPKWAEVFRRTNSADAALRKLPEGSCWAERRLLRALQRRQELDGGTACPQLQPRRSSWTEVAKEGFLALPRTIRALYAHSYVDRLWNLAATQRITCFGRQLTQGDLVYDETQEGSFRLLAKDPKDDLFQDICSLLLPRPGSGMQLPTNSVGSFMRSYLEYDGLNADDLNLEGPNESETWRLTGCMRPVLVRPKKLLWHLEKSESSERPNASMGEPAKVTRATNHFSRARAKKEVQGSNLLLDFHLGPGQYATMAMREVMRARNAQMPRHIVFTSESEAESPSDRGMKRGRWSKKIIGS